jgi:cytochrome c peroxidase
VAEDSFVGGNFWDGRATGWKLGNPAADQAQGPFLNPAEQALPNAAELIDRVCDGHYGDLFRHVWGKQACANPEKGYSAVALSIAAFEASDPVNSFSAKYDLWLQGRAQLSEKERQGLSLFKGKAHCSACHVMEGSQGNVLFTDFSFDNLGIPPNPENPFYGMSDVLVDGKPLNPQGRDWIDPGLGGFLEGLAQDNSWRSLPYVTAGVRDMTSASLLVAAQANHGKHRVPTLRNVDRRPNPGFVKAFGHNGYFKSLRSIVHFYNTRDLLPACPTLMTDSQAQAVPCWPAAEVTSNMNKTELGNLGLTSVEEDAIVAFLRTLSDG